MLNLVCLIMVNTNENCMGIGFINTKCGDEKENNFPVDLNEKCCRDMHHRWVFPLIVFSSSPKLLRVCSHNFIETQRNDFHFFHKQCDFKKSRGKESFFILISYH